MIDDRRPWRHASPGRSAKESRRPAELSGTTGAANIADNAGESLRVREQLLQGASQIKLVGAVGATPRTHAGHVDVQRA